MRRSGIAALGLERAADAGAEVAAGFEVIASTLVLTSPTLRDRFSRSSVKGKDTHNVVGVGPNPFPPPPPTVKFGGTGSYKYTGSMTDRDRKSTSLNSSH